MGVSGKITVGAVAICALAMGNQLLAEHHGEAQHVPGYTDTPLIPGTQWHVHDPRRPQPAMVENGGAVTTPAPSDAIVLFDGTGLDQWAGTENGPAHWPVVQGELRTSRASGGAGGGIRTKESFGDIQLHIEFRAPDPDEGEGQRQGNSGLFFMGRYELQVLDSFENPVYPDGQAAALYGQRPPLVNASSPSREWHSYDIIFEAPHFAEDGSLTEPAYITVLHNGVLVQNRTAYQGATSHRQVAQYSAHSAEAPLAIQDHGQLVAFRNIWVRRLDLPEQQTVPQLGE